MPFEAMDPVREFSWHKDSHGFAGWYPFPYNAEWKALVARLEAYLLLHQHKPGTLTRLDRFLHARTGGMIGTLSHQFRGAAVDAILKGTEKITKAGLLAVDLDIASRRKQPGTDG